MSSAKTSQSSSHKLLSWKKHNNPGPKTLLPVMLRLRGWNLNPQHWIKISISTNGVKRGRAGEHNQVCHLTQTGLECQGSVTTANACSVSAGIVHPRPQPRAAGGQSVSMAKLACSSVTQFYVRVLQSLHWPHAEPSLVALREYHFLQHFKLYYNNPSGKSQPYPHPFFFVFTWKDRKQYGKTKHKAEYDTVGKHWDSSI